MTVLTYRDSLPGMVPRWLKGFYGVRLLYAIGTTLDALGDSFNEGLCRRFPAPINPLLNHVPEGTFDPYALQLLGRQRGIRRGPLETDQSYALRLRYWRQSRKRKGCAYPLMEQLQAYLQPYPVQIRIHYDTGVRLFLAAGGFVYAPEGYLTAPAGTVVIDTHTWNWGGGSDVSRYWVALYGHPWNRDGTWSDPGLWNDYNTSDGTLIGTVLDPLSTDPTPTFGSTASLSTVSGVRAILDDWTPPHARCSGVILAFDQSSFDAISPDGSWNLPGNRDPQYVYWEGTHE